MPIKADDAQAAVSVVSDCHEVGGGAVVTAADQPSAGRAARETSPPWDTVYWYFTRWEQQKLTFRMVDNAAKKINERKAQRLVVTDNLGLLLVVPVLPANVQDRDDAKQLLLERRHRQLMSRAARRVRHLFTDKTTIEIVRKRRDQRD